MPIMTIVHSKVSNDHANAIDNLQNSICLSNLTPLNTNFSLSSIFSYIFQLNTFTINLRNSIHNVALALLFACLLQRALFLRAQKWVGLGGKISMLNQCITLLLIFCVQLALEIQKWR